MALATNPPASPTSAPPPAADEAPGWQRFVPSADATGVGTLIGCLIGAAIWGLAVAFPASFHMLELSFQRYLLQRRGPVAAGKDERPITIVTIDEISNAWMKRTHGYDPGGWDRKVYARVVEALRGLGAKAIGFDISFALPRDGTDEFAATLAKKRDTVLGVMLGGEALAREGVRSRSVTYVRPDPRLEAVALVGHMNQSMDPDEMVRTASLYAFTPGHRISSIPSLGLELATLALAGPDYIRPPETRSARDFPGMVEWFTGGSGGSKIQCDRDSRFFLSYKGPTPAFNTVSLYKLLDPKELPFLTWSTILPTEKREAQALPESRERLFPTGSGTIRLSVSPPDLEVEAIAFPAEWNGPWAIAKGRGSLALTGLSTGLHSVHVVRGLGPEALGIFTVSELPADGTTVPVEFPALTGPLEGRVQGITRPLELHLMGLGEYLGAGSYSEHVRLETGANGAFSTPALAGTDFYVAIEKVPDQAVSKGDEPVVLTLAGDPPVPEVPEIRVPLAGGRPGERLLLVDPDRPGPSFTPDLPVRMDGSKAYVSLACRGSRSLVLIERDGGATRGYLQAKPRATFDGAVVLIGDTTELGQDYVATPFDHPFFTLARRDEKKRSYTPGVEIHAHAIRNLLTGTTLSTPTGIELMHDPDRDRRARGQLLLLGLMLALCGAMGTAVKALRPVPAIAASVSFVLVYQELVYRAFASQLVWIHLGVPLTGMGATFVAVLWFNYITVERRRKFIRDAFRHYLDPDIVKELEKNPKAIELGGSQHVVTCFFSDIEGFSGFSEKMAPPELVKFMNEYLTAMSQVLLKYGGWIDKFIGDAIVCVFNYPRVQPDHALRCCLAALELKEKEAALREEWHARKLPEVRTRIGINTGTVIAGNVGTFERKNFTILGDAVNLAARLEALNKSYGTYLMIGDTTQTHVQAHLELRLLDLVRVKGRQGAAGVYEILGRKGQLAPEHLKALETWDRALAAYRAKHWDEAVELFQAYLAARPGDGPSETFLERITVLRDKPPPDPWDGTWTMEHK